VQGIVFESSLEIETITSAASVGNYKICLTLVGGSVILQIDMNEFKETVALAMFGRSRRDSMKTGKCVSCGKSAVTFADELSAREYAISGLCQECQDVAFCEPVEG
jgi:hypothetical protein